VLIYLSGGEGFGLQPLEAMACGCAVICADNTGMQEYLTPEIALPVECPTRVKSINYSAAFGGDFYQWQPSLEQAIAHIRWCYDHPAEVAALGQRAAALVAAEWTWELAGQRALALLTQHFGPD
jgi:glycosyltransferase involved in cell wall biosynthesis